VGDDPWGWWQLTRSSLHSWFLEHHTSLVASTDSLVFANHFDVRGATDPGSVPYLLLIKTYAQARRPDKARAWLDRYSAIARDSFDRRLQRADLADARGWIALAEAKPGDAVTEFSRAAADPLACRLCERAALGLAYDLTGQIDSTRAIYADVLASTVMFESPRVALWRGRMLERLGELYEARHDNDKALANYRQFVDLWRLADPGLQARVRTARDRIARLETVRPR
jgi:tetratricopeptide (TPR) repeat protein